MEQPSFQTLCLQTIINTIEKIKEINDISNIKELKYQFKEFINTLDLVTKYIIEWIGYIRYNDPEIYNQLYLLLKLYQNFIKPKNQSFINEDNKQTFNKYKNEIIGLLLLGFIYTIHCFFTIYCFFISIISTKSFEISTEIYQIGIGYQVNPIQKLNELENEYKKPIYNTIRTQRNDIFNQWKIKTYNRMKKFIENSKIKSITEQEIIEELKVHIDFRFKFLRNKDTLNINFDLFELNHSYRKELYFIDKLRKIKTKTKIGNSIQLQCIDIIKEYSLNNNYEKSEASFFTYINEIIKKEKFYTNIFELTTNYNFYIDKIKEKQDIDKVFQRHKELFNKVNIIQENKEEIQSNIRIRIMEYELSLESLPKINRPLNQITEIYFNLKTLFEKIYSIIVNSNDIKTLSILIYKITFIFRNFQRVINNYFTVPLQLEQMNTIINEIITYIKTNKIISITSSKNELLFKIMTLIGLNDIVFTSLRYSHQKKYLFLSVFGCIYQLNEIHLKIKKIIQIKDPNEISLFMLSKIYRDIFNLYIIKIKEFSQGNKIIKTLFEDTPIEQLLQNTMKYDEGDISVERIILSTLDALKSILGVSFSQIFVSNELYLIGISNYCFTIIKTILHWYFGTDKTLKWRFIDISHNAIKLCLTSEIINEPESEICGIIYKLMKEIKEINQNIHFAKPNKEIFNNIFNKSCNEIIKFFESFGWLMKLNNNNIITPGLLRISSFIKMGSILKKFIQKLEEKTIFDKEMKFYHFQIIGVIKGYLNYILSNKTYGIISNQYPDFMKVFQIFIKQKKENNINKIEIISRRLLLMIFERIKFDELFFECIKFNFLKERTHEQEIIIIQRIIQYFELKEFIYPSITQNNFCSCKFSISLLQTILKSKSKEIGNLIIIILSFNIEISSLFATLVAIFKKYIILIENNFNKLEELTEWIQITLKTLEILTEKGINYDCLMQMAHTILKILYYHPRDTLTILNPLSHIIKVLELYVNNKNTDYIQDIIFKVIKICAMCFKIENKLKDDKFYIIQFKEYIHICIKSTLFYISAINWEEPNIINIQIAFNKFDSLISELSEEYDYKTWKIKCWEYFIEFISDVFPVHSMIDYLKHIISIISFNLLLGIHFKKNIITYFTIISNILYQSEKFEEILIIGKSIYQFAYDNSQIGNREFIKINKIIKYEAIFKKIIEERNKIINIFCLQKINSLIENFEEINQENKNNKEIDNKEIEINQNEEEIKSEEENLISEEEEIESDNERIGSEEEEEEKIKENIFKGIEMIEEISKIMNSIFMILQSIEIDKKSRAKAKLIRLLTSVAEHFFNTADSLNEKILSQNIIIQTERLMNDSLCVRELIINLIELVITIRAVINYDKEKRINVLKYIELYDNYNDMITKIIYDMFLFLKLFKTFNIKRGNETKQILNRMVSGLIYFFVTPFIDIQIHDSTYVNSFIYNQGRKDHIIENSHVALLCAEFKEISKKNKKLIDNLKEMGDDMDEFVSFIGIKENIVETILPNMEIEEEKELTQYIQERVSILLNNTKPSFFFLAHVSLKAVESSKSLSIQLKSNPNIFVSCKREALCLKKNLKCLVAMINVFVAIIPKEKSLHHWMVELQNKFNERKNNIKKWYKNGIKTNFNEIYFKIMENFESEVKLLVRTICYTYFLYSLIIDELGDIIHNISMGFKLNTKYVKDVIFVLSCYTGNYIYHNRMVANLFDKIKIFITTTPYNKTQVPDMLATIEELKQCLVYRTKVEKRTQSINLELYKIKNPTQEQQIKQCNDLQILLQSLQTMDFGSITFRPKFGCYVIESEEKEKLLNLKLRIQNNEDISKDYIIIRNEILQEFIRLVFHLNLEHCMLIRQVGETFDSKRILYLEFYISVIISQTKILYDIIKIIYPGNEIILNEQYLKLINIQKECSLNNIIKNPINVSNLPKRIFEILQPTTKFDKRINSSGIRINDDITYLPFFSFLQFEESIILSLLKNEKVDEIKIEIFKDALQMMCDKLSYKIDFININKLFYKNKIYQLKSITINLFKLNEFYTTDVPSTFKLCGELFIGFSHLYYIIAKDSNEVFEKEMKRMNRVIEFFSIQTKHIFFDQFKHTLSPEIIKNVIKCVNSIIESIIIKKEDQWIFSTDFGKRILYSQILDLFNYFGLRTSLMYIHCFIRRDFLFKREVPWVVFSCIIQILKHFQSIILIKIDDLTLDNCIKLLKQRINEIVPISFDWSILSTKIEELQFFLKKDPNSISKIDFLKSLIHLLKACISYSFNTDNNKNFRQMFDIIEILHKTIHSFDFNQTNEIFIQTFKNHLPSLNKCIIKIFSIDSLINAFFAFKINHSLFQQLSISIINEYPFSKILKSIIEENNDGNFNSILLTVLLKPFQRYRYYEPKLIILLNELYLLQQSQDIHSFSPEFGTRYYSISIEIHDIITILLNCVELFKMTISNVLLENSVIELNQIVIKIEKEFKNMKTLITNEIIILIQKSLKKCFIIYSFIISYNLIKLLTQTFSSGNRIQLIKVLKEVFPLILGVDMIFNDDEFKGTIYPLKIYEDLFTLISTENLFIQNEQKINELFEQILLSIHYCLEYLQLSELMMINCIEFIKNKKYINESLKYLEQAFEMTKSIKNIIIKYTDFINPLYGLNLCSLKIENKIKEIQNQSLLNISTEILNNLIYDIYQKIYGTIIFNYSFPDKCRKELSIIKSWKETQNLSELLKLFGYIYLNVDNEKTKSFFREGFISEIMVWIHNFLTNGSYKSFQSLLSQEIKNINIINFHQFNRNTIFQQYKNIIKNSICLGFQQIQLAAELTHKSFKCHAIKKIESDNDNNIITLLSTEELQKIHTFIQTFKTDDDIILENEVIVTCSVNYDQRMLKHLKNIILQLGKPKDQMFIRSYIVIRAFIDYYEIMSIQEIYSKIVTLYTLLEEFVETIYSDLLWKNLFETFYINNNNIVIDSINLQDLNKINQKIPLLLKEFDNVVITYYKNHSSDFFSTEILNCIGILFNSLQDIDVTPEENKILQLIIKQLLHLHSQIKDDPIIENISLKFLNLKITQIDLCNIIEQMYNVVVSISENSDSILLLVKSLSKYCEKTTPEFNCIIPKNSIKRQQLKIAYSTENCLLQTIIKNCKNPLLINYGNLISNDFFILWKLVDVSHSSNFEINIENPYKIYSGIAKLMNRSIERLTPLLDGEKNGFSLSFEGIDVIEIKLLSNLDKKLINNIYNVATTFERGDTQETIKSIDDCLCLILSTLTPPFSKNLYHSSNTSWDRWFCTFRLKNCFIDLMYAVLSYTSQHTQLDDFINLVTKTFRDIVLLANNLVQLN
ncbi:hypothetical protein, conserved [Entamoeba dispar SAW760]|uniref:Uncharacterized protein n=1 Tax=Entamoeba dispar (strain ATCC PRA-260 / SAW760) TaxID=370354 RepID=B0EHV9_ENTDS|nr:uncharacterized protein EDI_044590 [Entamoeba dispar SAW760]EDR25903.1 hypothetical protein, conserved [Entamoeba dispar SAW760]|eukprot:EDR25903.1 hypothetical protein, conserved [Entamoeba dispar SAW760]